MQWYRYFCQCREVENTTDINVYLLFCGSTANGKILNIIIHDRLNNNNSNNNNNNNFISGGRHLYNYS